MAREPKQSKSETLTIRLDPKTRFILEYISRLRGQTITTVVERSIVLAADQATISAPEALDSELRWTDFWDVSEGVRALLIATRREFYPTFEDERRLVFAKEHWPFFWASPKRQTFLNHYVDVLWPRIDEYVAMHEMSKATATDYFAAAKAMTETLRTAGLKPPDFPPKRPLMTDEIPF